MANGEYDLLKTLQESFGKQFKSSEKIKKLNKALETGKVTYKEANELSVELGKILTNVYKQGISKEDLPSGNMDFKLAKKIIEPTMKQNYEMISAYSVDVQTLLNKSAGMKGIKGIKPELNQDRIDGIVKRVSENEDYDDIKWILDEPVKNFSQAVVDDTIRANVKFHHKLGLSPKIVRKESGHCCEWCKALAGSYDYPDGVPNDIYRRHRFCRCSVEYIPGNGKRQDIWSKKWQDPDKEEKIEKRKHYNLKSVYKKTVKGYNKNETESKYEKTSTEYKVADENIEKELQKRSDKIWKKKLLGSEQNALYEYSNTDFGITNRYLRNALLPDDDIVSNQTIQRIKELDRVLSKNTLDDDLTLYRGVSFDEFNYWKTSNIIDTYKSTSINVKITDTFDSVYKVYIKAPKNTKGFYLGEHSQFKNEKEFLLNRDQKYKILKIEDTIIEVEFYE